MERLRATAGRLIAPLALTLGRLGVSADMLTVAGFLGSCAVGALIAAGHVAPAGIAYLAVSALDMLDGAVARAMGTVRPFGAFLDSLLDRFSEAAVFVGLVYWYASDARPLDAAAAILALIGSFGVSYARARAEGLGFDCAVGWLQRPERVILLGVGMLFHPYALSPVLWVIAVLTGYTVVQRGAHVAREMRQGSGVGS